jgi:hypothetical protein
VADEGRPRRGAGSARHRLERVQHQPRAGVGRGDERFVTERVYPAKLDDDDTQYAIVLGTIRLYKRLGSPEGVAGWSDLGVVRILGADPDIAGCSSSSIDMTRTSGWRDARVVHHRPAPRRARPVARRCSVPVYGYLPDDVAHLPCLAVGRPSARDSGTPAVMTMTLDATLLGRRISDEDSQAELDALADELFDVAGCTRGVKIGTTTRGWCRATRSVRVW